jgi:mycothiol synthase
MVRPDLLNLPEVGSLPPGYRMRTYRAGDEAAWARLMNTGQLGEWTAERTRAELTGCPWPQFDALGLFCVTTDEDDEDVVGSACSWLIDPKEEATGTLHMVCVSPEHQGRRLSYYPCLAVLHRLYERGLTAAQLSTNDWRLGAVKVYLELGFVPVYRNALHPEQWRSVLEQLRWQHPVEPIHEGA